VVVAEARRESVPLELNAIGNVEAYSAVEVKAQVAGQLASVNFEEGQEVRKGQVLFRIDPRPFEQAVREAEAQLATTEAALGQAQATYERDVATAKNARSQARRYSDLAAKGIISREQNEQMQTQAIAAERAAAASKASIESSRANIQGAQARLSDTRLTLSYATITAPISGKTGNLQFKAGNLVTANAATPLVVINQLTPIYATFTIPEASLDELRRYSENGKLQVQATPAQTQGAPATGVLDFLDNVIDPQSGTIRLKARFANTDRRLWPGQFVNVSVRLSSPMQTVVPAAAVRTSQNGSYVFVVKPDQTADQRTVESPRTWQNLAVVSKGVNPGERVIVEGQLRVKPGTKVQIVSRGAQSPDSSNTSASNNAQ
jgi:multidrug efflux system membrane fusion protein